MKKILVITALLTIIGAGSILVSCNSGHDNVVARINGVPLTKSELNARYISQMLAHVPGGDIQSIPEDARKRMKNAVFSSMIGRELLYQAAEKQGVLASEDDVTLEISKKRAQYGSEKDFQEQLKLRGLTEERFKNDIRKELSIDNYLNWVVDHMSGERLGDPKKYYEDNPELFTEPESVHLEHIFIPVPGNASENIVKEKRDLANTIMEKLNKGENFANLAKEYSKSKDASNGGDLGNVTRGMLLESVEDAAFNMNPDGTPAVVESPFGFHVIRVTAHQEQTLVPFEDVKDKILAKLRDDAKKKSSGEIIKSLLETATIDTLDRSFISG